MCPIYTDQEEGNGVPDTLHTQTNTHMRARVLADHRDVGLLRNTGIVPLSPPPPPPPQQFKKLSNQHSSVRQRNTRSRPLKQQSGSAYAIILTLQFVNGCSCCAEDNLLRNVLTPQRLKVLCSSRPFKNALRQR